MQCRAEHWKCNVVFPPQWLNFRHAVTACSCTLNTFFLKKVWPSWTPLPFRATSRGTLSTKSLNRPKPTLWKASSPNCLPYLSRIKPSMILCYLCLRQPLTFTSHRSPTLFANIRSKKGIFSSLQSDVFCSQHTSEKFKSPHENMGY